MIKRKRVVETRAFPRIDVHHLVKYRVKSDANFKAVIAGVINISGNGILFKASKQIPKDTELELEVNFPGLERPFQVIARVVRNQVRDKGGFKVAAHFTEIKETERTQLVRKIDFVLKKLKERKSFLMQLKKKIKKLFGR